MLNAAQKKESYPTPLHLIFSKDGLVPAVGCEDSVPTGLTICNTKTGCSLTLEESMCLALSPIEIIYKDHAPKTLSIHLASGARLTLLERMQDIKSQDFELNVFLSPRSKLIHGQIITSSHETKTKINASIKKGAYYDAFVFGTGDLFMNQDIKISLEEELSECRLLGTQILQGKAKTSLNWHIHHKAPHTLSRQVIHNVLSAATQTLFNGKIHVDAIAQKTDGAQQARGLLLSDQAEMRLKPELEIYADDVKCAHGSTIGALDEEALFYLRSRGVPLKEAKDILVRAFIDSVVNKIQSEELRAAVIMEIEKEIR